MSFFRVAALLVVFGIVLCAVGESATAQNSATKEAAQPNEIPKSIAESVGGTLEFAEGNFLGLAEATAAFTGLRRGELSAMRWENWQPGAYAVNGSVWNARVDTTKTEGSAALIPVVPYLEQLWREHHQRVGKPRAGWMFATARNTPEWPENVVSCAIKPVLDRCVVCGKVRSSATMKRQVK